MNLIFCFNNKKIFKNSDETPPNFYNKNAEVNLISNFVCTSNVFNKNISSLTYFFCDCIKKNHLK